LSELAGAPERVPVASALNVGQHTKALLVGRRIIIVAQKPQARQPTLVDEPIDVGSRRLTAFRPAVDVLHDGSFYM
jgi:hypothetical protein